MALQYFAGGDPRYITWIYGFNDRALLLSVTFSVDAIHAAKSFNIVFPEGPRNKSLCHHGFRKSQCYDVTMDAHDNKARYATTRVW